MRSFRHRRSLTCKAIHKTAFGLVESRTGRKCTFQLCHSFLAGVSFFYIKEVPCVAFAMFKPSHFASKDCALSFILQ